MAGQCSWVRLPESRLQRPLALLVCIGFSALSKCPLTSPQSVRIPKIAVWTQTGNEKGVGSWRADRQEMGGLLAPREEANFRQLQCPLQLELAAKSAKLVLQLQPLSAWVWLANMELVPRRAV